MDRRPPFGPDYLLRCDAFLHPLFESNHHVMLWIDRRSGTIAKDIGSISARAVTHPGDHKEPIETTHLFGGLRTRVGEPAHEQLDPLVILDGADRRHRRIAPAVVLDQLPPASAKRTKVRTVGG